MFSSFDLIRIDHEIINPKKHLPHKYVLQDKSYLNRFTSKDEVVSFILNDKSKFRIYDYVGNQNRWSIFNVENVMGYHPAKLDNYQKIINTISSSGYTLWPRSILKLLNVKYLILPESDFSHQSFKKAITKPMYYFGNNQNYDSKLISMDVYEFKNFLPRLYFTKNIKSLKKSKIYDKIIKDDFNPEIISYLDKKVLEINKSFDMNASIELLKWSPDKIEFITESITEQFLILSEIYYPDGWVLSDGFLNYNILEVNNCLRGFVVPPGSNRFIMEFIPNDVKYGRIISIISFILIISILIIDLYKRKNEVF